MKDVLITEHTYPNIHEAFMEVACDNGMLHRYQNKDKLFTVPAKHTESLDKIEEFLGSLSVDDLDNFTMGEHDDIEAIANRSPEGKIANRFLTLFFEDWVE